MRGSSAQEEDLCRCSTLYQCLNTKQLWNGFYNKNREAQNALHTDDVVYTPEVLICKTDDGKYSRLSESNFIKVDVITCAAPNLRDKPNDYNTENAQKAIVTESELYSIHLSRARAILKAAKDNDVRVLVLGAFGCGAFRNDPKIVALAYKEALKDYAADFKEIEFAIFCKSYETENFDSFKKEFEK